MIPALDPATGLLPVGRYVCSEAEVEAAFVAAPEFAASATRAAIWADWQAGRAVLQAAVTVHAAWIGGSFTTNKPDPGDIDVTFLVNAEDFRSRGLADQRVVNVFASGQVKTTMGLRLDSYAVGWECIPAPMPYGHNPVHDLYYRARGYWDDWWQRCPLGTGGSPSVARDAAPRRGYLEVLFSDYS